MFTLLQHIVRSLLVKTPTTYSYYEKLEAKPKYMLISVKDADYYRIKALRSFSDVKKGDIGGYVSNLNNLSSYGNSWIYDDAKVLGFSNVRDDAQVRGNALMLGNSELTGNALLSENAKLYDNAYVGGNSILSGSVQVSGRATVSGNSRLSGSCSLTDSTYCYSSIVTGCVNLVKQAKISACVVSGHATISKGWLKFKKI